MMMAEIAQPHQIPGVLFLAAVWAAFLAVFALNYCGCIVTAHRLSHRHWHRYFVYLSFVMCLIIWATFLQIERLKNPLTTGGELFFDAMFGSIWFMAVSFASGQTNLREVADRRNHAAGWVIIGGNLGLVLCLGLTFVITPAEMEDMPVLFLGIGAMFVLAILKVLFQGFTRIFEAITIEREGGAALRLAALLVALGVLLGDAFGRIPLFQESKEHVLSLAAPVMLFVVALLVEFRCKAAPGPPCSRPQRRDFVIAALFLISAGGFLLVAG
jgi:hypothetical protein